MALGPAAALGHVFKWVGSACKLKDRIGRQELKGLKVNMRVNVILSRTGIRQ